MGYLWFKIKVFFMKEVADIDYLRKRCSYIGSTEKYSIYYDPLNRKRVKYRLRDWRS